MIYSSGPVFVPDSPLFIGFHETLRMLSMCDISNSACLFGNIIYPLNSQFLSARAGRVEIIVKEASHYF